MKVNGRPVRLHTQIKDDTLSHVLADSLSASLTNFQLTDRLKHPSIIRHVPRLHVSTSAPPFALCLPAHSDMGVKEDQVSVKCMADLANLCIVQGEGAISAGANDKNSQENSAEAGRGCGVTGRGTVMKDDGKSMGRFSLPICFQSSESFTDAHRQLIRLVCVYVSECLLGEWKARCVLICQAANDS